MESDSWPRTGHPENYTVGLKSVVQTLFELGQPRCSAWRRLWEVRHLTAVLRGLGFFAGSAARQRRSPAPALGERQRCLAPAAGARRALPGAARAAAAMATEDEIIRIAKKMDKMVQKKNAVSAGTGRGGRRIGGGAAGPGAAPVGPGLPHSRGRGACPFPPPPFPALPGGLGASLAAPRGCGASPRPRQRKGAGSRFCFPVGRPRRPRSGAFGPEEVPAQAPALAGSGCALRFLRGVGLERGKTCHPEENACGDGPCTWDVVAFRCGSWSFRWDVKTEI